ncbi:hypothetical protein Scani_11670 [Streptomyces caniferus]|uniref:Uncharacterized protein n=1 Tax=Streptomyces caniferus TaxID=285557 RepID=A0A640S169_9ACTN|nr:hypothetical protein Scani_11670 [Streptomyces caniferus]
MNRVTDGGSGPAFGRRPAGRGAPAPVLPGAAHAALSAGVPAGAVNDGHHGESPLRMHIIGRPGPGDRRAARARRQSPAPGRMRTLRPSLLNNSFARATSCVTVGGRTVSLALWCGRAARSTWAGGRDMVPEGERGWVGCD